MVGKNPLPEDAAVSMKIYNTLGQEVATVIGGVLLKAGTYEYKFDANKLAAGVYIYRLEAGNHSSVKKMLYLK